MPKPSSSDSLFSAAIESEFQRIESSDEDAVLLAQLRGMSPEQLELAEADAVRCTAWGIHVHASITALRKRKRQ